jgi:Flp pilus assembly protein TadG
MRGKATSKAFLRRFGGDSRGVSAVEFALIAPVLIVLYFALAEFCQGYMAQKRMGHAGSQVADIVAQSVTLTRDQIADIFAIGGLIMAPFPSDSLSMRVSHITRDTHGVARVDWSRGQGMGVRSGVVAVPAGLIDNGESIIMSESIYDYASPVGKLLPGTTEFNNTYYLRPRLVEHITCSDC